MQDFKTERFDLDQFLIQVFKKLYKISFNPVHLTILKNRVKK